ncbi:hypothetical protein VIGAN_01360700 [Vigna angularis var. angularis]|uniref:Uncharacterized protein n=1 Tax=Vigna angularis var. angularis TaxID=157739 RepID=A0A0S3R4W5_PHAAN|nr:hypothetical protein VIGAN_01360700 [Vigna angularis var. angularis]
MMHGNTVADKEDKREREVNNQDNQQIYQEGNQFTQEQVYQIMKIIQETKGETTQKVNLTTGSNSENTAKGLRSSLGACPKTKVRVDERNLPHLLGLGLRSSLGAHPKTKVRVHERNLSHLLGLGLRSSLEACPKTKVRVHERNLPHLLGLGLRSSLGVCPKTKVRVHKRRLSHRLV